MTYTDLNKRTEMAATGLQNFGIAKNDVICVISQNQLDYVVAFYASALIGSIFQPIDPSYTYGNYVLFTLALFISLFRTVMTTWNRLLN